MPKDKIVNKKNNKNPDWKNGSFYPNNNTSQSLGRVVVLVPHSPASAVRGEIWGFDAFTFNNGSLALNLADAKAYVELNAPNVPQPSEPLAGGVIRGWC